MKNKDLKEMVTYYLENAEYRDSDICFKECVSNGFDIDRESFEELYDAVFDDGKEIIIDDNKEPHGLWFNFINKREK